MLAIFDSKAGKEKKTINSKEFCDLFDSTAQQLKLKPGSLNQVFFDSLRPNFLAGGITTIKHDSNTDMQMTTFLEAVLRIARLKTAQGSLTEALKLFQSDLKLL